MDSSPFIVLTQECGIVGFRSRRAIARAASTDLGNIHRMPAPEGYCILVFEELSEQEEENTPGIPGGSLIFNPHDVENRTNIGELFFWSTVSLMRGELELHSPGQSPLLRDRTLADGGEEIRRPETPRPSSGASSPPFLTPSPIPALRTTIVETSPANGLEALRYHDNPAPHFDMSILHAVVGSRKMLCCMCKLTPQTLGMRLQLDRIVEYIKEKTGRFEGFLVCTQGGRRERSQLPTLHKRGVGRHVFCQKDQLASFLFRPDVRKVDGMTTARLVYYIGENLLKVLINFLLISRGP